MMKKRFLLPLAIFVSFALILSSCNPSVDEPEVIEPENTEITDNQDEEKNSTETEESNEVDEANRTITISSDKTRLYSDKEFSFSINFEGYKNNPSTVDLYIDNDSNVFASNISVTEGKVTISIPSNFSESIVNKISFFVQSEDIASNKLSFDFWYTKTNDELSDFISTITTTDIVNIFLDSSDIKAAPLKNENIRIYLDLSKYSPGNQIGVTKFRDCTGLYAIDLSENIYRIKSLAFQGCSNLTKINIPDSVTYIESAAFKNCSSLTEIDIPDGVPTITKSVFENCSSLTEINIPDSVTSIEDPAFKNCSSLTEIDIPDGVTSIKTEAFSSCSKLATIELPSNLNYIGEKAFNLCSSLTSVVFKNTSGWKTIDAKTEEETEISSDDLTDTSKAAQLLTAFDTTKLSFSRTTTTD